MTNNFEQTEVLYIAIDLVALMLLITLAYSISIMSGDKIKNKEAVKYVGRVKEKNRPLK